MDVGGSGLRVQVTTDGVPGPVLTAPGARIGSDGIDVPALAADARALAGVDPEVVVWSMRGLLFLADRTDVARTVRAVLGGRRTVVVSDAVANLVGALGGLRPGAVVAAGSGAVAFGTDFGQVWRRVDGWGHLLGDVGSGAWIGLEGLRAALRAADGLPGGSSAVLSSATAVLGAPEGWPRRLMGAPDAPERLAALAPVVAGLADADPVAAEICARAGAGLAEALLAAAAGLPAPVLTATGGVLGASSVRRALTERLALDGQVLAPAAGGALDGGRLLGTHLAATGQLPEHLAYLLVQ